LPVIKECREAYGSPTLAQFPGLPVVTMGEYALESLWGGNRVLDHDALYSAKIKDGRLVLSTYHPGEWLSSKAEKVRTHIQVTLGTVVKPMSSELMHGMPPGSTALWYPTTGSPTPSDGEMEELFKSPWLGLDIEIDVPDDAIERDNQFPFPWEGAETVWVGLTNGNKYYLLPADYALSGFYPVIQLAAQYEGVLFGHNINGDLVSLAADGLEFPKATHHDTMLWYGTMPLPPATSRSLKWRAKEEYGASAYEAAVHTAWDQKVKTSQIPELIVPYLTLDLYYHWKLFEAQKEQEHPSPSFALAMDYLPVIMRTEVNGFAVDLSSLETRIAALEASSHAAEQRVQDLAKAVRDKYLEAARAGIKSSSEKARLQRSEALEKEFDTAGLNLNSPAQMKAFFQATGLNIDSTNEKVLVEHQDHPAASSLLEFRGIEKERHTYALDWQRRVLDPRGDGLLHGHYSVSGAETTRLRCSNPNEQNIPGSLRDLRISRYQGGKLINSDLSAIEYRIIAHMSEDARLRQLFLDGIDIHRDAAARVYGIRPEQVTKEQRKVGKTFNFAGVYGAGPEKIFSVIGREDMKLYYKEESVPRGATMERTLAKWAAY